MVWKSKLESWIFYQWGIIFNNSGGWVLEFSQSLFLGVSCNKTFSQKLTMFTKWIALKFGIHVIVPASVSFITIINSTLSYVCTRSVTSSSASRWFTFTSSGKFSAWLPYRHRTTLRSSVQHCCRSAVSLSCSVSIILNNTIHSSYSIILNTHSTFLLLYHPEHIQYITLTLSSWTHAVHSSYSIILNTYSSFLLLYHPEHIQYITLTLSSLTHTIHYSYSIILNTCSTFLLLITIYKNKHFHSTVWSTKILLNIWYSWHKTVI